MDPVTLRTRRLVLSSPVPADADRVTEYCRDPLFESYLTTPWPYRREHAEFFLGEVVPSGWRLGREFIWALRESDDGPLLGVVGAHLRRALEPRARDLGFWLGAPHRGSGLMAEAARSVVDWLFAEGRADTVHWECVVGNLGSARTARAAGFAFTGLGPAQVPMRDGSRPPHWQGRIDRHGPADAASARRPAVLPWPAEIAG